MTLLENFRMKVEEAINIVPQMDTDETFDAVECWNTFSEKLQEIVHKSAEFAEIEAIALSMDEAGTSDFLQATKSAEGVFDFSMSVKTTNSATTSEDNGALNVAKDMDKCEFANNCEKINNCLNTEETNNNSLMDDVDDLVNCANVADLDCLDQCANDSLGMAFADDLAVSACAQKRVRRSEEKDKRWECAVCSNRFKQRKSLRVHMRKHTGDKPYCCSVCGKSFTQSGSLRSHLAVHADSRPHACVRCGRAFRQRSQLRTHMQRHDKLKRFHCTTCQHMFLTRGDLRRHERTHTGERLYRCELCDKSYARRQSLELHLRKRCGLTTIDLDQLMRSPTSD